MQLNDRQQSLLREVEFINNFIAPLYDRFSLKVNAEGVAFEGNFDKPPAPQEIEAIKEKLAAEERKGELLNLGDFR